MATDVNLQFIREKIYEIRNAVMYSMSDGLIKIPNNIVSVLEVDDEGQLWFICTPPAQKLEEYECVFPARLHFYKKGKSFHIEVSGKATIVNNAFNCQAEGIGNAAQNHLLIRMDMINIEYTAANERKEKSKMENMLESGYKWLLKNLAIPRQEKSIFSKLHQTH